jgi:GcrA cell cycle regulator
MRANWTAEELKILDELKDNHTPSEIAKVIPSKTRSAISSRMSRDRAKVSDPSDKPEKKKRNAKESDKTEEESCEDIEEIEDAEETVNTKPFKRPRIQAPIRLHPLDKIGAHDCRWPLGTPGHADFAFCGEKTGGFGPYCEAHTKIAFTAGTGYKPAKELATK